MLELVDLFQVLEIHNEMLNILLNKKIFVFTEGKVHCSRESKILTKFSSPWMGWRGETSIDAERWEHRKYRDRMVLGSCLRSLTANRGASCKGDKLRG